MADLQQRRRRSAAGDRAEDEALAQLEMELQVQDPLPALKDETEIPDEEPEGKTTVMVQGAGAGEAVGGAALFPGSGGSAGGLPEYGGASLRRPQAASRTASGIGWSNCGSGGASAEVLGGRAVEGDGLAEHSNRFSVASGLCGADGKAGGRWTHAADALGAVPGEPEAEAGGVERIWDWTRSSGLGEWCSSRRR